MIFFNHPALLGLLKAGPTAQKIPGNCWMCPWIWGGSCWAGLGLLRQAGINPQMCAEIFGGAELSPGL